MLGLVFKLRPHWWEASALTTAPLLLSDRPVPSPVLELNKNLVTLCYRNDIWLMTLITLQGTLVLTLFYNRNQLIGLVDHHLKLLSFGRSPVWVKEVPKIWIWKWPLRLSKMLRVVCFQTSQDSFFVHSFLMFQHWKVEYRQCWRISQWETCKIDYWYCMKKRTLCIIMKTSPKTHNWCVKLEDTLYKGPLLHYLNTKPFHRY